MRYYIHGVLYRETSYDASGWCDAVHLCSGQDLQIDLDKHATPDEDCISIMNFGMFDGISVLKKMDTAHHSVIDNEVPGKCETKTVCRGGFAWTRNIATLQRDSPYGIAVLIVFRP